MEEDEEENEKILVKWSILIGLLKCVFFVHIAQLKYQYKTFFYNFFTKTIDILKYMVYNINIKNKRYKKRNKKRKNNMAPASWKKPWDVLIKISKCKW